MNKKFYLLAIACLFTAVQSLSAQTNVIFEQLQEPTGSVVSGSSSMSRSIHLADDFSFATDTKIKKVVFDGAQIFANLPSILVSADFFIVEGDVLSTKPGTENVIYKSVGNLDGVTLLSSGFLQNFEIDLGSKNIYLNANKKYWVIFSANISTPSPSNLSDWHNYPGYNTAGTSLARRYTNGAWDTLPTGLTFKIEATNSLGTTDTFVANSNVFATTMVSQSLEVKLKDFKAITVFDLSGKQILHSEKTINNIAFLAPGIYLGVINTTNGKRVSAKFIKK